MTSPTEAWEFTPPTEDGNGVVSPLQGTDQFPRGKERLQLAEAALAQSEGR